MEAALQLVVVIGDVARKVGVAAVGFLQRAVLVVAVGRRFEQRLKAVFPFGVVMAFGLLERALVDEALFPQHLDRGFHLIAAAGCKGGFGEENVVTDVERGEVVLDHLHHPGDGE